MKKLVSYIVLFLVSIPFYSQVQSYYNGLDLTKTENELFLELSNRIISTHSAIPYTGSPVDIWDACKLADEDPDNAENVLLIYGYNDTDGIPDTDRTRNKNLQDTGSGNSGVWNREHVFAKSLANPPFGTDEPGPGTDAHNLRPADRDWNSIRSNRKFTDGSGNSGIISANGGWYPGDEWKGDIARIVMYMYLRYHGDGSQISETNCLPINVGFGTPLTVDTKMIDLFLRWNVEDPVSNFEANRNEVLAEIQMNRNPFIDNPYLATLIWGGLQAEDKWWSTSSSDFEAPSVPVNLLASNLAIKSFDLNWDTATDNIGVYDYSIYLNGVYLQSTTSTSTTISNLTPETSYNITIKARDLASNFSEFSAVLNVTTLVGPRILLEEFFEDCANVKFSAYNEASDKNWACTPNFGEKNSGSYGINGYQEDVPSKDWLITNESINFDSETGEKLSFYTDATYGTSPLNLVYSSDYDGFSNPNTFNWSPVPNVATLIHNNSNTETIYSFTDLDISSITGTVYFAFKYYSDGNPTRWTVDSFEITAAINDDVDNDGILNENDLCPNTPIGETVDANGCSIGQLDDDNDGIQNSDDLCENTPSGEVVNTNGCSQSQLDDDVDGVMNNLDTCENTPTGETVNANGCSNGQLDDDNDGVTNSNDHCPNSSTGSSVNANGCFRVENNNFNIETISETCPGKNNGKLIVTAQETHTYLATLNGTNVNFTGNNLTIDNLEPKSYTLCISVAGEEFEQCFIVNIDSGITISGKSTSISGKVSFDIEQGTAPFKVFVNDKMTLETYSYTFDINAKYGDLIQVKTTISCEGLLSKTVNSFNDILAYPNPSKGNFEITLPFAQKEVIIELYTIQAQLISAKTYPVIYGKVQLNIENKPTGIYFVKVNLEEPVLLKIIKE